MTDPTPPEAAAKELEDAFAMLGDWESRYQFIIDLGKKLPKLDPALKVEPNRVHGCQATVFLSPRVEQGDGRTLIHFDAESDAMIVSGLIAILRRLYSGRTPRQIVDYPAEPVLGRLGLEEHLSPTRRNGLHHMVKRIRDLAAAAAAAPTA